MRKPNTKCRICGKGIYKRPSELEASKNKSLYCSPKCYQVSCRKWKTCPICGGEFLSGKNSRTCSRACANRNRRGINYNRNPKGGPRKDKVKAYRSLRDRLIKKFGPKCYKCKYDNLNILQIHHIKTKKEGGGEDLSNLQLLCPNCHMEIHQGDSRK